MTELQQDIAKVAVGALVDLYERESDLGAVRYLTLELELTRGKPIGGRAWVEWRVNVGRLLGVKG